MAVIKPQVDSIQAKMKTKDAENKRTANGNDEALP